MNRSTLKRLESLERQVRNHDGKVHMIFGHGSEELRQKERDLMASPEWTEGDHLLAIRFVSPGEICPA